MASAPAGLGTNAELDIRMVPAQSCRVRVMHEDAQSLTLGTLTGHPEAGRITFGAYSNPDGHVIFHIRSRARSASISQRIGFLAIGDAMQTNTWSGFINNIAAGVGAHIPGAIRAETKEVEELPEDDHPLGSPTVLRPWHRPRAFSIRRNRCSTDACFSKFRSSGCITSVPPS